MPLLSAFTPFGLLEFSSAPSKAEVIYRAVSAASGAGTALSAEEGTEVEAENFCDAMAFAFAHQSVERAARNMQGATATELLGIHEDILGITPPARATIAERQAAVAAKALVSRGSRPEAIDSVLHALLGDDFVTAYVVPSPYDTKWPAANGGAPGLYSRVDVPAKTVRITDPIAPDFAVSGEVTVPYENWDTSAGDEYLILGESVLVESEVPGAAEIVTVTAVAGTGADRTFKATFTKAHPKGASATTKHTPLRLSARRHILVILKQAAALDPGIRRKVNDTMRSVVRGVTTWSIVHDYTDGSSSFVSYALDTDALDTNILATFTR